MDFDKLRAAEQLLNIASTPDQIREAHALLKSAIYAKRRREKQQHGVLAQTYTEAMRLWDRQKSDGIPRDTRLQMLEQTLRAAWPQRREWKVLCNACGDTGWIDRLCSPMSKCDGWSTFSFSSHSPMFIERRMCTWSDYTHRYITPCHVCPNGDRAKAAIDTAEAVGQHRSTTDEAGHSGKPTRIGR